MDSRFSLSKVYCSLLSSSLHHRLGHFKYIKNSFIYKYTLSSFNIRILKFQNIKYDSINITRISFLLKTQISIRFVIEIILFIMKS